MNPKAALWVPVFLGGATGALLAITGAPARVELEPAATPASSAEAPTAAAPAETPTSAPPAEAPTAAPSAPEAAANAPSIAPSALAAPAVEPRPAFDLAPPATREALLDVELRCDRKNPEDCERAARALEAGAAAPKDASRAAVLRRIALTLYVKQCESGRALACARLAEMYAAGETVQQSPRSAEALRARSRDLCAQKPGQPGCAL